MRFRREWVAPAVALYITAAYWFTSSTSFANPAITIARSLTNIFAGAPHDVPLFIAAQLIGASTRCCCREAAVRCAIVGECSLTLGTAAKLGACSVSLL